MNKNDWRFTIRMLSEKLEGYDLLLDMYNDDWRNLDDEDKADRRNIIRNRKKLNNVIKKIKEFISENTITR